MILENMAMGIGRAQGFSNFWKILREEHHLWARACMGTWLTYTAIDLVVPIFPKLKFYEENTG